MNRKTKIICTIGPACESEDMLDQLISVGMDIARFNFSHASYDGFVKTHDLIKMLGQKYKKNIEILVDLQGPRIRVGQMPKEGQELKEGTTVVFTSDKENKSAIYIDDPYISQNIQIGHPIYLSNGEIELMVIRKKNEEIEAKVIRGGILYSRKAVNVPETVLTTTGLTQKDVKDIWFVLPFGIDYIGQSFIKNAHDIFKLRQLLGNAKAKIIAKIETKQSVHNIDWIVQVADLIMIARGDLGIELPLEDLPLIQKDIINRANIEGKPAIVATQMLSSMVNHHRPTRAEISDVANAVLDGAWGVMLSEETAFGKYPVEAVCYLHKTISKIEEFQARIT
ncbi:MAG: pyruvate kinase [Candidatus Levybacteria bacterium]|nr:pyruvate kinase [Candidatus Levybacteria bacterium]